MELNKIPQWMLALEPEDAAFLKNFALKSGSLKEIARLYQVSYPTVRLRLDKLIQKIELADQHEEAVLQCIRRNAAAIRSRAKQSLARRTHQHSSSASTAGESVRISTGWEKSRANRPMDDLASIAMAPSRERT